MAVTKLLHLKQSKKTFPSGSLCRCIHYIFKREKTEDRLWVGGNCGTTPQEVYHAMMDTKRAWEKLGGRQGYHFIVAFEKGETDEAKAYQVLKEWCEEYFGDDYEYAFSIHNDREHMHGHIVFNSVSRTTGYKYRYEKGDWEKYIQPVTDRICDRHGLKKLIYENSRVGKKYAEHMAEQEGKQTWKKIIQKDIDYAISKSKTYEEVLQHLKKMEYEIRSGLSEKHGEYLTLKPPGAERGRRTYLLGKGYQVEDIRCRVQHKEPESTFGKIPKLKKRNIRNSYSYTNLSRYQVHTLKRNYRATHYHVLNPYRISQSQVRRDLLTIEKLSQSCRYLIRNHITSEKELQDRMKWIQLEEKTLRNAEAAWNQQERNISLEYQKLKQKLNELASDNDSFEELLDRMEELEAQYPDSVLSGYRPGKNEKLEAFREEKKFIRFLQKEQEKELIMLQTPFKELVNISEKRR